MGLQLPDYVQQGLGWSPDMPPDDGSAAMPAPPPGPTLQDFGGIHPDVARQLGLAPPLPPPPIDVEPLPPPTQLPSMVGQSQGAPPHSPDYQVPPSAFGGGQGQGSGPQHAVPPPSAKPQSFDAQMADLRQREQANEGQQIGAIGAGLEAQQGLHADQTAAIQQNQATLAANDAKRQQLQEERDKVYATNTAQVDADRKAIENYKTNPNKFMDEMGLGDHLRWGIAQIMAGFGQALMKSNGPNPVTEMLQSRIHEANVAQRDQRDQMVQRLGFDKEARNDASTFSANRLADIDHKDGLANLSLAKSLELAASKAADPIAAANAMKAAADVRKDGDALLAKAIDTKSQHDLQQAQLGISRQQVGIAGGHLALAQKAEARAQKLQDLEWGPGGFKEQELGLKAADEMRKALADQKKRVADDGVFNPVTGAPMLNAKGNAMMAQADQIEAGARQDPTKAATAYVDSLRQQVRTPEGKAQLDQMQAKIQSDPAVAQQLAQGYADKLRSDAKSTEVATISDKEDRRKVTDTVAAAQKIVNVTAKIKEFLKNDPEITDREAWGKLQAQYGQTIGNEAKFLGATASSREFQAISSHILDFDPSSWIDRATGKTPAIGGLEGLESSVKGDVDALLKSKGITSGWTPSSPLDSAAPTFGGRTANEVGEDAKPGLVSRFVVNPIAHPIDTARGVNPAEVATEAAMSPIGTPDKPVSYGLDPADDNRARALIQKAEASGKSERSRIVESIAAPIEANDRPSLSAGLLNLVRDEDPALYQEILAKLTPQKANQLRQYDSFLKPAPTVGGPAGK